MIYTGLVSVTFRQLKPIEIIRLVKKAGLDGIEWGGDIHVPHGDIHTAIETFKMTEDEGLHIAAYGSYYQVGCQTDKESFEAILGTAVALHAPTIRVWAGNLASNVTNKATRESIIADTVRIADIAAKAGVTISFEYHPDTLTDTSESACRLMNEVSRHNIRSYWQINTDDDQDSRVASLYNIIPWLSNVHVSCVRNNANVELIHGSDEWMGYINVLQKLEDERFCMIEFVKDHNPDQFLRDADVLKGFLSGTTR